MLDKPFAGFRRRSSGPRFIREPRGQGIAPVIAALLASVVGAIASKAMEQKKPGQTGQPMNLNYTPTVKGAMEQAQARAGGANVGQALAGIGTGGTATPPIAKAAGAEPFQYSTTGAPAQGTPPAGTPATTPSPAGMGAEVGPPKPTAEEVKANATGEGSWMDAARMGVAVGGGLAESMTPKPGPIGGLFHGSPNLETTLPSAKERLLRYLGAMNRGV